MSKCRPKPTKELLALEKSGVRLSDVTTVAKDSTLRDDTHRNVVISIPYEALRDDKDVQIAFQNLVTISTTP